MIDSHTLPQFQVIEQLNSDQITGLTKSEVRARREQYGRNEIPPPPRKSPIMVFLSQFNDLLIYILIAAALISLGLAFVEANGALELEYFFDAIVIVIVLLINAILGFYQEYKAENAVVSLQKLSTTNALVLREGEYTTIDSSDLVPGDIVTLQTGDKVPADLRLLHAINLRINESALTGESQSVNKNANTVFNDEVSLGDRENMAYMGTIVELGKATAIVVTTGNKTEVGKISSLVAEIDQFQTPLQRKLHEFSHVLAKFILIIAGLMIILGITVEYVHNPAEFNTIEAILGLTIVGVSLAVAAIPEGLPIILTFTLAISVQKLAAKNSIIRKIQAVEALGSVTFIATDKTGTLTLNDLKLDKLVTLDSSVSVRDNNYSNLSSLQPLPELMAELTRIVPEQRENSTVIIDPLDKAIKILIQDNPQQLGSEFVEELPFDSDRKLMSVLSDLGNQYRLTVKGAPDIILSRASRYYQNGKIQDLTEDSHEMIISELDQLADDGYRVIAVAYRELDDITDFGYEDEQNLIFVGYMAFIDPPRTEVKPAIITSYNAGIAVAMITGDHPKTAVSIAKDLGITRSGEVLTGVEIERMSDEEVSEALDHVRVFARVTPEHKLRLVNLLQQRGEIVAMTGDGVNDSPALVKADVGIAMGIAGTDAAKESAEMILVDDNFTTLATAVEEGRLVKDNISKFTNYLLASNTAEVMTIFLGFFLLAWFAPGQIRDLIPISETQILYLNLVTDSFLALALGLEKKETNLMMKPPHDPAEPIITTQTMKRIVFIGLLLSTISMIRFYVLLGPTNSWNTLQHSTISHVQSYVLTLLVVMEIFVALSYRSTQPVHKIGYFSNSFFTASVILIVISQLSILYLPGLNILFDTQPLRLLEWITILISSLVVFALLEITKQSDKKDNNSTTQPVPPRKYGENSQSLQRSY